MNRRHFLRASATSAGGLLLSFHLPALATARPFEAAGEGEEINAWLTIAADDAITIRVAQSEMGEGVFTSLPMIVADELGADWSNVRAEYADPNRSLREDGVYQRMGTGGSRAVRHSLPYLLAAGANARERLLLAAARRWGVPAGECKAANSVVTHNDKTLRFGQLAAAAAAVTVEEAPLKPAAERTLIGTSQRRLEVPAKVDGSAAFSMDVRLPGMVYAAVKHCPVIGGTVKSVDAAALASAPGAPQVVKLGHAVAVVADSYWQAQSAVDALPVAWDNGPGAGGDSQAWRAEFAAALDEPGVVAAEQGDVGAAFAAAESTIEADYFAPYLAHACMEPLNCTVHVQAHRADIWTGMQNPEAAMAVGAEVTGLPAEAIYPHNCFLGGGFGRRLNTDWIREALVIGQQVERPVQLIWSRAEDTRQGFFRPMSALRFKAGFDADGKPIGYANHSVTHSILAGVRPDAVATGIDPSSVEGLANLPYAIANTQVSHTIRNTHLTTWFWRSVGATQNAFARECFIDEMAAHAGQDPFDFRRALLGAEHGDTLRVLAMLEEKSDWGRALPPGRGQGMAVFEAFGSVAGQVAEVSVSQSGDVKVERVVCVLDCGNVVNPLTVEEQIEGGVVYGLSAALFGKITVADGAVAESNFHDYPVMRMTDMPVVETHLALAGGDKWGGVGEPGLPPAAPAVCNAIWRATGKRVRSLPIADLDLSWT